MRCWRRSRSMTPEPRRARGRARSPMPREAIDPFDHHVGRCGSSSRQCRAGPVVLRHRDHPEVPARVVDPHHEARRPGGRGRTRGPRPREEHRQAPSDRAARSSRISLVVWLPACMTSHSPLRVRPTPMRKRSSSPRRPARAPGRPGDGDRAGRDASPRPPSRRTALSVGGPRGRAGASMRSGSRPPDRRSFTWRMYSRKPVSSVE